MQTPPSRKSMPIPGANPDPMASPSAMGGAAQAERKATREVPREQLNTAMQKGADAVAQALYKNRKTSGAVLKMIDPQNEKVGSTAKAVTTLLSEVNKRAQVPERIRVPLAMMAADELMQMAEEANIATYSEEEAQQVLMTTSEILLQAHGVDPNRAKQLASQASQADLQQAESAYNSILNGAQANG